MRGAAYRPQFAEYSPLPFKETVVDAYELSRVLRRAGIHLPEVIHFFVLATISITEP